MSTVSPGPRTTPRRIRHSEGGGALGFFETQADVRAFTRARLFEPGARTPVAVRFSRTLGFLGGPDSWRDVRGFAVKFFTPDGEYDLVGNNSPVFFLRDDAKFASLVRAQDLVSDENLYHHERLWDFYTRTPQTAHQVTWLLADRGIPASWRHLDGFGVHTFAWRNEQGERFWVRYHLRTDQGHRWLSEREAAGIPQAEVDYYRDDLRAAIEGGDEPAWTVFVQIMAEGDARACAFDPFDATKVWPKSGCPLRRIGRLVLDRLPDDEQADIEGVGFSPTNLVPGIEPSPDPLLRARSVGYPFFSEHRVGRRPTEPVTDWPVAPRTWPTDDFGQAGAFVRDVLDDAARARLAATIAAHLRPVSDAGLIVRALGYWHAVDPALSRSVAAELTSQRHSAAS
ncbi:catalase [Microbacterium mangrovi]|uniref:catalase n=1 Tax=Microbacterium mangrovi TaxID=1348253 RepID=UPI00068C4B24|nr:catalase [Microbacterium mangrovi]